MAGAVRRISRAKRLQIDARLTELFTYCAVHLAYLAYLVRHDGAVNTWV
jgi:hypothetical protein